MPRTFSQIKFRFFDVAYPKGMETDDVATKRMSPIFTFEDLCKNGQQILLAVKMQTWIPMQFTGLLDRKGREIYEGDIVQHAIETPLGIKVVRGAFYYNKNLAQFGVDMALSDEELKVMGTNFVVKDSVSGKPEIIGNIYENPELLK